MSSVVREASCVDPGERKYSCSLCGDEYSTEIPALGHDWLVTEETATSYALPPEASCPDCGSLDFAAGLDEDSATYSCACSSCERSWTISAVVTEGHTLYTCSRCGETTTELEDEDSDLFNALGNFIANGIDWVTDKLVQLVDSLTGINDIFSGFVEELKGKAGEYPAFLSAAIAVFPEDLMTVFWFSIVAFVGLIVWKRWFH